MGDFLEWSIQIGKLLGIHLAQSGDMMNAKIHISHVQEINANP